MGKLRKRFNKKGRQQVETVINRSEEKKVCFFNLNFFKNPILRWCYIAKLKVVLKKLMCFTFEIYYLLINYKKA